MSLKELIAEIYPDYRIIKQIVHAAGYGSNEGFINIIYKTIEGISDGKNPNKSFADACEDENFHGNRPDIVKQRAQVAGILKLFYKINIDLAYVSRTI